MPKQKLQQPEVTKKWGQLRHRETARKVELYSQAYKLALQQISPTQRRKQPDISLRIHASIRRQLKARETDARVIASEAVRDALGV
jgi:hypothetical protein